MESKAVAKFVRITPRKVRIVLDLIRGKNVAEAFAILKFTPKAGADVVEKVLRSAVANAENNFDMDVDKLFVKTAFADERPDDETYSSAFPWTGFQNFETHVSCNYRRRREELRRRETDWVRK